MFKLNLPRTSIYLFLKAAADKTIYRTAGKFIGRGPSARCQFPWLLNSKNVVKQIK